MLTLHFLDGEITLDKNILIVSPPINIPCRIVYYYELCEFMARGFWKEDKFFPIMIMDILEEKNAFDIFAASINIFKCRSLYDKCISERKEEQDAHAKWIVAQTAAKANGAGLFYSLISS